jgi:putative DNA primase/helicase
VRTFQSTTTHSRASLHDLERRLIGPDPDRIQRALSHVPPEDRDIWLRMGMAIKSELGDSGRDIWDTWAQGADNYSATDARDVWKSIKPGGAVTIATLWKMAGDHGWREEPAPALSPEEEAERERQREATRKALEASEAQRREEGRAKALALWEGATEAVNGHGYLDQQRHRRPRHPALWVRAADSAPGPPGRTPRTSADRPGRR